MIVFNRSTWKTQFEIRVKLVVTFQNVRKIVCYIAFDLCTIHDEKIPRII